MLFDNTYLEAAKKICLFSGGITLLVFLYYVTCMDYEDETHRVRIKHSFFFLCGISALAIFLCIFPHRLNFLMPCFILFTLITVANTCSSTSEYLFNEYYIPALGMLHNLVILIPTQWRSNVLAFALGMVYFMYIIYSTFGKIKHDLVISLILACFWFTLYSVVLYSKLKSLYSYILKWERLIKENKKILQIFPHGVIITDEGNKGSSKWFSNEEFDRNIWKIKERLDELNKVEVCFTTNKSERENLSQKCNLQTFLKKQQQIVKHKKPIVETNTTISEPKRSLGLEREAQNDEKSRSFIVKSMQVDWEGINSYLHVFIDTTNIVKLEEAKNNIKCQKIMFASVSHEFRTPLNAIVNSYQFIGDMFEKILTEIKSFENKSKTIGTYAEHIKKFIKMGNNSSILLLALIDDILDLSKMEAGTFTIHNDDFYIQNLIDEVSDIFSNQCEQKKITFDTKIDKKLTNTKIWSDKGRIKQILLNLISNAVKFTFVGSIILKVRQQQVEGGWTIIFDVCDTGIGIKDENKHKLFNLFGMISDSKGLNPNGTGIGLTIWRKYLEKLNGDIKLESQYGVGTVVSFWVPIVQNLSFRNFQNTSEVIQKQGIQGRNSSLQGSLEEDESIDFIWWENHKVNTPLSREINARKLI